MTTAATGPTPVMDRLISRTVHKRRPLSVHFDLTYRCNERCVHCYLDHDDHGELTTAECIAVMEDLARGRFVSHLQRWRDFPSARSLRDFGGRETPAF